MSYALYRMPYADSYVEIRSARKVKVLASYENIGMEEGFVVAPFENSFFTPIVLIQPDEVKEKKVPAVIPEEGENSCLSNSADALLCVDSHGGNPTSSYSEAFAKFHEAIGKGRFMKLVLSRSCEKAIPDGEYEKLFFDACRLYPRLMIMLVSTERTGTWLVASPEILLTGDGSWWRTMALAGTMPYEEGYQEWSEKNQQEQRFVEAYIEERLSDFSVEILKDGPRTQRAGNLVHLCTDFRFHLADGCGIGEVLASLHPTPAICGIPKERAREFILNNENTERSYYSGFMGPMGIAGGTHLYVSLRCARLEDNKAVLYAGGGIMPESTLLSEWEETQQKMKTIENVLQ